MSKPERRGALTLLRVLRAEPQPTSYVRREAAKAALGFEGESGASAIGGIVGGLVKLVRSCGLDPADVIQRTALGYRAGPLLRLNELPEGEG